MADALDTSITELGLSTAAVEVLVGASVHRVADLVQKTEVEVLRLYPGRDNGSGLRYQRIAVVAVHVAGTM